jgi:hypothetical protein
MIDTSRRTAGRTHAPDHVWVCTFDHRDGTYIWACATEALAYRELAAVCREFWDEAREVDDLGRAAGTAGRLADQPPDDDQEAVEYYFAVMNDSDPGESFQIAALEVVGAAGGADR